MHPSGVVPAAKTPSTVMTPLVTSTVLTTYVPVLLHESNLTLKPQHGVVDDEQSLRPSKIALLLDLSLKELEQIIYFNAYIVIKRDNSKLGFVNP